MSPLGLVGVVLQLRVRPWFHGPSSLMGSAAAVLGFIQGGGMYLSDSTATIADTKVYGNTAVRTRLPENLALC